MERRTRLVLEGNHLVDESASYVNLEAACMGIPNHRALDHTNDDYKFMF